YSLGIILYEMLTGDVPYKGSNIPSIMKKHLMAPPPPLASPESGISAEVEKVVHRALEKQPETRTESVEEFIAQLEQAVLQPAPAKAKTKRRNTGKATAGTRRRKTVELPSDESLAQVEVKEEPVFAQDVNTVQNPIPHVQSENEAAKLLRTVRTPSTNQPEPAPSEGNGKVDAPPKSKLPARPVPEQRLPGRVVISQQSLV